MSENRQFLIMILASLIRNQGITTGYENWEDLYAICEQQNITGLVASVILKMPKERQPDNLPFWLASYVDTLRMMTRRNAEFDRMIFNMHEHEVDPICVKGSVLRKLYPDEALRTMGDYDIWIKSDELPKLEALFTEQGYSITERLLLIEAEKGDVRFEIFASLEQEFGDSCKVWEKLFRENACRNDDGILVLPPTYELFYVVLHTSKHYLYRGCGIRNLLDIVLILQNHDTQINYELVLHYCKETQIEKMLEYILSAAKIYFHIDTPITKEVPKTEIFVGYMLEFGVFGPDIKGKPFSWGVVQNRRYGKMKLFFPPYKVMLHGYPFLKKSKLLLPVAWVGRGFKGIFVRKKTPAKMLADMQASEEFSKVRMKYLKELGLWYE